MQSTVGTFVEGDYILASYLDGTKVDTLPTKSDSISVDHIDCDNNALEHGTILIGQYILPEQLKEQNVQFIL
jgi:hypothetical protein